MEPVISERYLQGYIRGLRGHAAPGIDQGTVYMDAYEDGSRDRVYFINQRALKQWIIDCVDSLKDFE